MIPEILQPGLNVLFVGTAVTELCDSLGFYHLHPRDRFWELLAIGGITPARIITATEAKALAEGHRTGSLTDPVKLMFIEKKTGQLLRLGVGLTDLNRRVVVPSEKDPLATPTTGDIRSFTTAVAEMKHRILAFVMPGDAFVHAFKDTCPGVSDAIGPQTCVIGGAETWLLGSTTVRARGEAMTKQEDTFFALGERIQEFTTARGS